MTGALLSSSPVTAAQRPGHGFDWPMTPHAVLRTFDPPEVKWGSGHRGVDLAAAPGSAVVAPSDATVTFSGTVAGRGVLTLHHREGFDTTYEPVTRQVARGERVTRGQRIAIVGSGGHCDGVCLHWGYRVSKDVYRDPLTLVRTVRPILLPPL